MRKVCRFCKIEKDITEFRKSGKYYRTECKDCANKYNKQYYSKNKKELSIKRKPYHKQYYQDHKEEKKQYQKEYREQNIDKVKNARKQHYNKNKKAILENSRQYYQDHKERLKQYHKEYSKKNRALINSREREKRNTDKIYKLKHQVRNMLYDAFRRKGNIKSDKTENILGCKLDYFIDYLLDTYKNNYGVEYNGIEDVHIDHIKPLASAKNEKEILELCHYKNLQLLKAKDNLQKGDDEFFSKNFGNEVM